MAAIAKNRSEGSGSLASSSTLMHTIEVREDLLVLSRKLPPKSVDIRYSEIASVEHKRLIDYALLLWVAIPIFLAYLIHIIPAINKIIEALLQEIELATGSPFATVADTINFISAIFIIISGYYMIRFSMSLMQRLVIYRTGKNPIAVPMTLTGDSMKVLAEINRKVKESSGMSKEEVEKFIGEQIRSLLDERAKMQEELVSIAKTQLKAAKTAEEKAKVKEIVQSSMDKLKAQDEAIDRELKKTGLKKEDLYKKYRIKPPEEAFVDSILSSEGVDMG